MGEKCGTVRQATDGNMIQDRKDTIFMQAN
jgi:hypothetical protein